MDLFDVIMSFPLVWRIITVVIIIVLGNFGVMFRKKLIKKVYKLFKIRKIILSDHELFTESSFLKHQIKRIDVGNVKKNEIFIKILCIKYDSIMKHSKELMKNKDLKKLSNSQFYAIIIKNVTEIIDDYNIKLKNEFGEDIYNLVMLDKEKGFNNIHEKTVMYTKKLIEQVFKNEHIVYKKVPERLDYLFDMYFIAIKTAMSDVGTMYVNFNGDLDKLLKKKK